MITQDDRTPQQKQTHTLIVIMTDSFMSGWGLAEGGPSYAGWACQPQIIDMVEARIRARDDARRVRIVLGNYRPPTGPGHCHIYVADD
jgi:hypothetical protein